MTRIIVIIMAFSVVGGSSVACGDRAAAPKETAPASNPTNAAAPSTAGYTVISETSEAPGTLLATIQVPRSAREAEVRSAVESFVASRRAQYNTVAVRTYFEGASESDSPYAISRSKGDTVKHEFFSSALEKKIPTH